MSIRRFCKAVKNTAQNAKKESVAEYLKKSKITLVSDFEMTIEGELLINSYDECDIKISSYDVGYNVSGTDLNLCYIKSNTLRITGKIQKIRIV